MTYDTIFFDRNDRCAIRAAEVIVGELAPCFQPESFLDVGCGRGIWAQVWKRSGCSDILGVDGDHVDRKTLHIDVGEFRAADLSYPFDLGRRFDLVQCLEVAEHLPADSAAALIDSITQHGDVVLFSAAVPGQGGMHHVNEQPLEYWRNMFSTRGYAAFDMLRPRIYRNQVLEPCYRFNPVIYANAAGQAQLPGEILQAVVEPSQKLREYGPLLWQIRKSLLRLLPMTVVDKLAQAYATIANIRAAGSESRMRHYADDIKR